jgi:DNA-3-methyladenine glycosylase I
MDKKRCRWAEGTFDEYIRYHDEEWGVPNHDDAIHFEFLVLESAQAGLSWSTILKRREGYRKAFANFEVKKVAAFDSKKINELVENTDIIRNRAKIEAAVNNAKRFLEVQQEFGSFDKYIWGFVGHQVKIGRWEEKGSIPATTAESDLLAKDLKKRGFKFLGSTTIYAHMQAVGLINDHTVDCFRFKELT